MKKILSLIPSNDGICVSFYNECWHIMFIVPCIPRIDKLPRDHTYFLGQVFSNGAFYKALNIFAPKKPEILNLTIHNIKNPAADAIINTKNIIGPSRFNFLIA